MKIKKLTEQQVEEFNSKVKSRRLKGTALVKYKENLAFTEEQKDVIVGTLLGDASIRNSKSNYCLKFEQKYTQLDYLIHLYKIFEPFVGTGPKMRIIRNSFHKDYGVSCWFRTYAHICFKYYENQFYQIDSNNKRKKIVPKNIHQMLTPRVLAYWFMDDGSYVFGKPGYLYCFNTQGFTFRDQIILIKALKRNFNLDVDIKTDKHYYRLVVQYQSSSGFKDCLSPYILPTFEYKLKNVI